jgi:hypothetical protein
MQPLPVHDKELPLSTAAYTALHLSTAPLAGCDTMDMLMVLLAFTLMLEAFTSTTPVHV